MALAQIGEAGGQLLQRRIARELESQHAVAEDGDDTVGVMVVEAGIHGFLRAIGNAFDAEEIGSGVRSSCGAFVNSCDDCDGVCLNYCLASAVILWARAFEKIVKKSRRQSRSRTRIDLDIETQYKNAVHWGVAARLCTGFVSTHLA